MIKIKEFNSLQTLTDSLILQLLEAGQTGAPGVPAVPPVVQESSSAGENVQSQLPRMEERIALVRCSELNPVTLHLVLQVRLMNLYSYETSFSSFFCH